MGFLTRPCVPLPRRPLARTWTLMLLLVTCLLHWARMAMPVCAVTMAKQFGWSKTESGLVLGSFYWGYCFTQVLGGHASDKWVPPISWAFKITLKKI